MNTINFDNFFPNPQGIHFKNNQSKRLNSIDQHHINHNIPIINHKQNIFRTTVYKQTQQSQSINRSPSRFSPSSFQRKTFNVNPNRIHLTPKVYQTPTSPRINTQESTFLILANKFNKKIDAHNNLPTNRTVQLSIRSGLQSNNKTEKSPMTKNSIRKLKTQIVYQLPKQNKIKRIYQQKINMEKILNISITKNQRFMSPRQKRGQSPQSTRFSSRNQFADQVRSIQQRKHSQNLYNLPKAKDTIKYTIQPFCTDTFNKSTSDIKKQKMIQQLKNFNPYEAKMTLKKKQKKSNNQHQFSPQRISLANTSSTLNQKKQDTNSYKSSNKNINNSIYYNNDKNQNYLKSKNAFHRKTQVLNTSFQQCKIGHFIFGKVIGNGKFGEVYEAKHKKTGFLVAIKKIYKSKIKQYNLQKQLIQQIRLQAYTSHPNIVNMYGLFFDANHIYLILQFMEGGTLFDFLYKNQKLPPKQVSIIMKQVSLAVNYLHQNLIAHRDIKPQNILFSLGVAKLCDFGWSARVIDKRKTYCGTFDYVPPQMLERKQYDESVDLWCLGVLMFELLTGKVPFEHKQKTVLMNRIINVDKEKIEYPDFLCEQAIEVIEHLLRKNPQQRLKADQMLEYKFFKTKFQ